jgi:2-polyprenyl-3-methyl-5-hydroxy-6-metoxy-1,4-benzoquinol methylase
MRCYICDATDWHVVTVNRGGQQVPIHSDSKIQICKNCGNACHYVDVTQEEKIKEYYRKEYRPQPNIMNLVTTTHKINYIRVFMQDYLRELKGKKLVVGDVGAATGYVLNFFRNMGHRVAGSELTITYRRMSEHYYGIPLAEELEPKHKYDLIVVYHVLEHLMEPDKKLKHYASLLNEGGKLLVATPEWFDMLDEASGTNIKSFDHLFHKNHINLFSANSIQNLFRKCGLRIAKEDHIQYGQTYLLEKRSELVDLSDESQWLNKEDWREVLKTMLNHEHAINLYVAGKIRDALALVPKFPEAWLALVFARTGKDVAKQIDLMAEADKHVTGNFRYLLAKGQWHYQQSQMIEAIQVFEQVIGIKPNEDTYMFLGYALAQVGRGEEACRAFQTACAMDPRKWQEAQQWMLNIACAKPTWDERALAEASKALRLESDQPHGAAA